MTVFRLSLCLMLLIAPTSVARAAESPDRVVSANLCGDQLLMSLADPDQIASLSPLSRDPQMSFLAAQAKAFPVNRASGEDLVKLDADLILTGPYDNRYTRALLAERAIRFEALAPWTSLRTGEEQVRWLATLLGHPERGEKLIAEIETARKRLVGLAPADATGRRPSILVLHRRGYVFHVGLTGELLASAGFVDAAAGMGIGEAGFVGLETILRARPDYLLVSRQVDAPEDQGEAFLEHPALTRMYPPSRRLVVSDRLTLCGGPSTPALIDALVGEIRAKVLDQN